MENKMQAIYINMNDSGKLVSSEKVSIYAGLVFVDKKEKDRFITQYRKIINQIRCSYCSKYIKNCIEKDICPEIKHNMLKHKHIRWIMNYLKQYSVVCCIINNNKVFDEIKNNKASRGRFLDYSIKLLVKNTIKKLIEEKRIDPNRPIKLVINIDEQTTKTNGYYNLKDGIFEELKYGIINYNYGIKYNEIIYSDLDVEVNYQHSDKSYLIQSADLIAGTVRRTYLDSESFEDFYKKINFVDYLVLLP